MPENNKFDPREGELTTRRPTLTLLDFQIAAAGGAGVAAAVGTTSKSLYAQKGGP
jgi:hypothetical protein